ncbi:MAG: hypothetical protein ACUVR4_04735 [Anaerolineae bacterium]
MRGILAGLIIALVIAAIAFLVAGVGSLGVAVIGWLLGRWFDLSQWQGSLIALAMMFGLGYLIYKITFQPAFPTTVGPDWEDWEEEEEEEEELAEEEPPIVPWRRNRPTPGELPVEKKPAPAKQRRKQ